MSTPTTATISRFVGTCQVCAATHKLTTDMFPSLGIFGTGHKLVHHAFTRPGDGEIHGGCYAVGRPAYEESCDTTREYLADVIRPRHAYAVAYLARLTSGGVTEIREPSWRRGEPPTVCTVGNPSWALTLRAEINKTEHQIRGLADEIKRLEAMISDWVARPLRTIEEFEAPARAERDAAKAKRTADRQARTDAKIASYRKRLATAVRKRTASTIADIFESAPRQLADRGLSRAQAFEAIGSAHVFAAFGLDPTQGCDFRTPNGDIVGAMRNGTYDAATRTWAPLAWPASL